jgi:hypothetical protein
MANKALAKSLALGIANKICGLGNCIQVHFTYNGINFDIGYYKQKLFYLGKCIQDHVSYMH